MGPTPIEGQCWTPIDTERAARLRAVQRLTRFRGIKRPQGLRRSVHGRRLRLACAGGARERIAGCGAKRWMSQLIADKEARRAVEQARRDEKARAEVEAARVRLTPLDEPLTRLLATIPTEV